jgi:hypothetical protein
MMKSELVTLRMSKARREYLEARGNIRQIIHRALEVVYPDIPPDDRRPGAPRGKRKKDAGSDGS